MEYLHAMIRVFDLEKALDFFVGKMGLVETRRRDSEKGRYSLVFLATHEGGPEIELTHNWDEEAPYTQGRNFGHLAFAVPDIYEMCQRLMDAGVTIQRPPRDGRMAFVRSPDQISIEFLQKGASLPPREPWVSMPNTGTW